MDNNLDNVKNNRSQKIYEDNCSFAGLDLVLLSTLVSITLAQDLTINQLNILSTFLQAVGENLSIIATSRDICQDSKNT